MVTYRRAGRDHLIVDAKFDATLCVHEQAVTLAVVPFRHQALRTVLPVFRVRLGCGGPYPALQGNALDAELRLVDNEAV
jgi:hypothetical protein